MSEYKNLKIKITSNTPSEEAIKNFSKEIIKLSNSCLYKHDNNTYNETKNKSA